MVVLGLASRFEAEVVLHIAVAAGEVGHVVFRELVEDDLQRFVQEICENVEAPAVRHPHDDLVDSVLLGCFEQAVEGDHHRLTAVEPEALLGDIGFVEEGLE